ncbi:MAG: DUF362 domain-containing protein [Phycisphaerales bacterium]|nr:MAG: DUF362 domain-containing protein [Phycisphaerales bacterium]
MRTNRRQFLEQVAAWSAGVAASAPVFRIAHAEEDAADTARSLIAVAKGKDYEGLVAKVLEPLGGIGKFVKKGDKVIVKPNMAWDRRPEQAANTHPDVVKALVKLVLDAGAKEVQVVDRTCADRRRSYRNSGIPKAIESIGDKRVTCPYFDERKVVPVKIEKGKVIQEWELYRDAVEADCYINVPIAKNHAIARLTLGLKNIMGVMGGDRGKIHRQLAESLADLNSVIVSKFTLIDATRILLRRGPQGGNLDDVKVLDTLIASTDMVAADAYATTLFDLKPEEIRSTVAGYEMGLGEINLDKVKIVNV